MAQKRSSQKQKSPTPKRSAAPSRGKATAPTSDRLSQLERLIELMEAKDVVEVELEDEGTRWRVRRTEPQTITYAPAMPAGMAMPAMPYPHAVPAAAGAPGGAPEAQGEVFKSPMLGTFYSAPSPEAEAFVKAGDRVNADRTLCIIEAMKVMNEIKAERDFEVLEVLVKNGEPVEYGQPLFLIR